MNINIYYGGRGLIDDPTLTVLEQIQTVFEELRVTVHRYNLYEYKNTIPTLPQTLKDADAIVLASTVEWYGYGGYLAQFLDACWQFGDKERIAALYMMPVILSKTYGEREALSDLETAWEILGGKKCEGISGYIASTIELEMNDKLKAYVEKKAEDLYRAVNQRLVVFPGSNQLIRRNSLPAVSNLSPQESEQLSEYVSDDHYVQTQKEDIQELTSFFKGKLESEVAGNEEEYLGELKKAFAPQPGVSGTFSIVLEEKKQPLLIKVAGPDFQARYGAPEKSDVEMEMNRAVMDSIISGRMTFQRAFMSGEMKKMKGDFRILCSLDQVLVFKS
ncbi:MAG: SCP2 sterol-binding domain-containing protein [Lachnospiraceae bacterium]|jgi:putative sterol carrier protein|nr:SCP2 sterol-binding domain-containing protein [Lachnospiraceae bacterium]